LSALIEANRCFLMPRYFFHLFPSGVADTEGQVFATEDEARGEAEAVARELARNRTAPAEERIVVTDETGTVVCDEPIVTLSPFAD
jgi:hypothetical protein